MNERPDLPEPTPNLPQAPDSASQPPLLAEPVPDQPRPPDPLVPRRRLRIALLLFVATCASTLLAWGWVYSLCVMTILVCHEAGHFLQARRYGVSASFPYFLPMPIPYSLGTLGAVIVMDSRVKDRRALFDIGITGPLAGLVPTLIFCILGLQPEQARILPRIPHALEFGDPLLFKMLVAWILGPVPEGHTVYVGPMAFAGWVGLLITAINLFPVGQLDGGHILYGLLRRRAHPVAMIILLGAVIASAVFQLHTWWLMLALLILIGPKHPPTCNDHQALGPVRIVLGWLVLAFFPLGFTPEPFV